MLEFVICYTLLALTVFGISSGILYSELVKEWKDAWIKYWAKSKHLSKLQYYGVCQLCISVPITLFLEWLFLPYIGIIYYILFAISIAGISWMLGGITLFCYYGKYAFEQYAKYRGLEFRRGRDDLK
jgi:hypothetical protein